MPNVNIELKGTNESITRRVATSVIDEIREFTGLNSVLEIVYTDNEDTPPQIGSAIGEDPSDVKFSSKPRITMTLDEDHDPLAMLNMATARPEALPVFYDKNLNVVVRPMMSRMACTLTASYKAPDAASARRWRDGIRRQTANLRDQNLHRASYHYIVPEELIYIMRKIHELRENVGGYGETFDEYFQRNSSRHLSTVANSDGSYSAYTINQTQREIVGAFDFTGVPEKAGRDGESDAYSISFSYIFYYDKPVSLFFEYPLTIHNQTLPEGFYDNQLIDDEDYHQLEFSESTYALYHFQGGTPRFTDKAGLRVPEIDDFIAEITPPRTFRLTTILTTADLTTPGSKILLNLKELGIITFDQQILDFFVKEGSNLTKLYNSVFYIGVYQDKDLLSDNLVSIDNTLNVGLVPDLNLRKQYRVVVDVVYDLNRITEDALKRLKTDLPVFYKVLELLYQYRNQNYTIPSGIANGGVIGSTYEQTYGYPKPLKGTTYIPKKEIDIAIDRINKPILARGNHQQYLFATVMTLFIRTRKMPIGES